MHSPFVTRVLTAALFLLPDQSSVPSLARAVHMHERTLRRKLSRENVACRVHRLLNWARLLHAAWWLRDPARPLEHVAVVLQCSAASNPSRLFNSYADVTPQQLRDLPGIQGVELLIARMRAEVEHAVQ